MEPLHEDLISKVDRKGARRMVTGHYQGRNENSRRNSSARRIHCRSQDGTGDLLLGTYTVEVRMGRGRCFYFDASTV